MKLGIEDRIIIYGLFPPEGEYELLKAFREMEPLIKFTEEETRNYDIKQVASHSTSSNCWTIIDNKVYDLTSFFGKHDGWDEALEQLCWTYWDELFKMQHWWAEKPETTLKTMYKGEFK